MPSERILFDSPLVKIGRFVCAPEEADWRVENVVRRSVVVFPSMPVRIHQADREPVVADRNVVMYYNAEQPYRRGLLHERGDDCVWIALKDGLAEGLVAAHRTPTDPERPFDRPSGPSPAQCYLRHQVLQDRLAAGAEAAPLAAEEAAIELVRELLAAEAEVRGRSRRRPVRTDTARSRRELVETVREILAIDPGRPWSLEEIVDRVLVSAAHLCRLFKEETGATIHQYLIQLRLREAAQAVLDGERDLSLLAVRLGFSSHSHFTETFRRAFGLPPRELREDETVARLAEWAGRGPAARVG